MFEASRDRVCVGSKLVGVLGDVGDGGSVRVGKGSGRSLVGEDMLMW